MKPDLRLARSWLFVPGDSERKLARCWDSGADALILDLEDSVLPENKAAARRVASAALAEARGRGLRTPVVVRLNSLATGQTQDDIAGTMAARPDGYVVPKVATASELQAVAALVAREEARAGLAAGTTALVPIATETPEAVLNLRELLAADPRVEGLFWGMEDLAVEMGARYSRRPGRGMLEVFRTVRSLALLAGAAAGIAVVDTPFVDLVDAEGLAEEAREAGWMGFTGKLAIHPAQVEPINRAFSPTPEEIAEAETLLAKSAEGGGAAFRHAGRMIDTPHLVAARRLLARAGKQNG